MTSAGGAAPSGGGHDVQADRGQQPLGVPQVVVPCEDECRPEQRDQHRDGDDHPRRDGMGDLRGERGVPWVLLTEGRDDAEGEGRTEGDEHGEDVQDQPELEPGHEALPLLSAPGGVSGLSGRVSST
jgi:hypothetical protein